MKKSKAVTLILLTGALCVGCEEKARNQYASWDDCVKDYRNSTDCREEKKKDGSGIVRSYYYGPWYRTSSGGATYNPSASTHRAIAVVRGGWGSTGGHASS